MYYNHHHHPNSVQSKWRPVLVFGGFICLLSFLYILGSSSSPSHSRKGLVQLRPTGTVGTAENGTAGQQAPGAAAAAGNPAPAATRTPVELAPTYQIVNGSEVVYQVPTNPKGVLFVAHGCNHGAVDWWPKHTNCPDCTGLPVEVNITREALARGYAVVAISSMDRDDMRCWMGGTEVLGSLGFDTQQMRVVLPKILQQLQVDKLPTYALGASSGGAFVLSLAMGGGLKLAGVCSQIMSVPPDDIQKYMAAVKEHGSTASEATGGVVLHPLPPVMFVHMPLDSYTAQQIAENIKILQAHNIPVKELQVHPAPLTPTLLHEAAPDEITLEQSEKIYAAFMALGYLDDRGMLTHNPRAVEWQEELHKAQVPGIAEMRLQPDLSAVGELLNVLYAGHEIISTTTTDMLDWFESFH